MGRYAHLRRLWLTYLIVALALYGARLTSILHAESSAVVAFFAFFITGLFVLRRDAAGASRWRLLGEATSGLLLPWLLLSVSQLWVPNCAYATGLLLYVTFTVPSVVLGLALATLVEAFVPRFRRSMFLLVGLVLAVVGVLYDLALHPQFYTLNHVFGGVLGPIYEDALFVRPGLILFRIQTLLWAGLALVVAERKHAAGGNGGDGAARREAVQRAVPLAVAVGLIYAFAAPLGINTPTHHIRAKLGGMHATEHFDIYFDRRAVDEQAIELIAEEHEFRYERLVEALGVHPSRRIQSYLYPTVSSKIRLTGAGLTDVAPVWLREPQMHLLLSSFQYTFAHELVHVFSREFGMPLVNASPYVALVEGLAVALEPPGGRPSPRQQVAVSLRHGELSDIGIGARLSVAIERMMSPQAFWGGRGAVSYTVAGAFIAYLLETRGVEKFRRVYASGAFEDVYDVPLRTLALEWEDHVRRTPYVTLAAHDNALRRFVVPSLFERDCPHYQPPYAASYRAALDNLALGDTLAARRNLARAVADEPHYAPAVAEWARLRLADGQHEAVAGLLGAFPDSIRTVAIDVLHGDALAIAMDATGARRRYAAAMEKLPSGANDARALVLLRLGGGGDAEVAKILLERSWSAATAKDAINPARRVAAALRLAESGRFEEADRFLASMTDSRFVEMNAADERFFRRMLRAWSGVWAYRAGNAAYANRNLTEALREATTVGDDMHAAQLEDHLKRVNERGSRRHGIAGAPILSERVDEAPLKALADANAPEAACR